MKIHTSRDVHHYPLPRNAILQCLKESKTLSRSFLSRWIYVEWWFGMLHTENSLKTTLVSRLDFTLAASNRSMAASVISLMTEHDLDSSRNCGGVFRHMPDYATRDAPLIARFLVIQIFGMGRPFSPQNPLLGLQHPPSKCSTITVKSVSCCALRSHWLVWKFPYSTHPDGRVRIEDLTDHPSA